MNNEIGFKQNSMYVKSNSELDLLGIAVLATAIAGMLYFAYFQLAPWIWSQNLPFRPEEIAVWQLLWLDDRDGIELYALYVLMFVDLFLVYILSCGWHRLSERYARYFLILPTVVACVFFASIGFHPPMSTIADHAVSDISAWSFMVMIVILPIIALLYYLQQRSTYLVLAVAALLLIPACFISTAPIEWYDYSFMLAPALRLYHGAGVSEIYLPYDLLLSLIGLAWMKLRFDLNSFQVVAQCAYYLLLLGVFSFSRRWLIDKRLPVFLLIALVLVRIYAGPGDAVHSFQLTPIRLDLGLILLVLVSFKGPYHWSAGLFCGLLILFHHNFGIIYSAAYIQLLLTLCAFDTVMLPGGAIQTLSKALARFLKRNSFNLALMLMAALAHYLLFKNADVSSDLSFEKLGISFTKISANSFYWYLVVVTGLSFTLLLRLRSMLSSSYLATGFCLIYVAIGDSLYFFGHSHENAMIVLSAVYLLLLFLLLDLVGHALIRGSEKSVIPFIHRNLAIIISLVLIASITIWYGDNITHKAAVQARNAGKGQFIYPSNVPEQAILKVISEVNTVTGGSHKVYFVGDNDFLFDYYGGYAPVGYYNPVYSWISKREFNGFLQGLVDHGYYLVVDNSLAKEVLSSISVSNYKYIQGYMQGCVMVWK
jgi:hypothetical protein